MALTPWSTYASAAPDQIKQMTFAALVCKGVGVNTLYPLEVDAATGALPFTFGGDTNYGVVGASTMRTAAQIGNATGAANFGAGVTGAQTLRTVIASDQAATMATESTLSTIAGDTTSLDTKFDVNLSTVATQVTSAAILVDTGTIAGDTTSLDTKFDVNLSTVATQATSAVIAGDTTSLDTKFDVNLSTRATEVTVASILADTATIDTNVATIAGDTTSLDTKTVQQILDYGLSTGGIRTAAQLGNAAGEIDYDSGVPTAQTIRTALCTRHEAAATPLATRSSNGTNFDSYGTGSDGATVPRRTLSTRHETASTPLAFQKSNGTNFDAYGTGADGATVPRSTLSTRHEAAATPLAVRLSDGAAFLSAPAATSVIATYDHSTPVTTAAYTQLIASTGYVISKLHIFDSSGKFLIIATGGAGAETDKIYLPPGGSDNPYEISIPAGTRISIKALDAATTTGRMVLTGLS